MSAVVRLWPLPAPPATPKIRTGKRTMHAPSELFLLMPPYDTNFQ